VKRIEEGSREYNRRMLQVALGHCPLIVPCRTCGSPVASGYVCDYCHDSNPRGPAITQTRKAHKAGGGR